MDYTIIIRPLIGAAIGYVTNWVAVKMMFRPLKPIKLGNFTLPFTPGIIPKNKERLAESIGESISNNLLTEETLKNSLLSEDIKLKVKENIIKMLNSLSENDTSVKDTLCLYISDSVYDNTIHSIENTLSNNIFNAVLEANLGNLIAEQIVTSAEEKLKGSILNFIGGKAIVSSISENAVLKVNAYIQDNGKEIIEKMVKQEIDKYTSAPLSGITTSIAKSDIDLVSIFMNIYESFIIKNVSKILNILDISKIIKEKIDSMDVLELEKLLLLIMKKELNALINLGAIIGLILGMINLLF